MPKIDKTTESPRAKTILLVEDEVAIRKLMQSSFRQQGYRILAAENGVKALELADQFEGQIDLMVTDVAMPQMDGTTLAIIMGERRPNTKVLFVSGYPSQAVSYFRENPLAQLMHKPFRMSDLLAKVEQMAAC